MLPMQEILRIRHLSLVLMRSWLRLWWERMRNYVLIGQQKGKTFVQLLFDWMRWCRCGRGFICMHFPRLLCSLESWREFAGTGFYYFHCPAVAGKGMVPRYNIPSRRASSGAPHQEGPSVPSGGLRDFTPTRTVESVGLASEGAQLIDSGFSTEVVESILHSRAPSMRKLYALRSGGWSFTPARSCGSCGCGSWGGTTHSLWSLNWGCWDHPLI